MRDRKTVKGTGTVLKGSENERDGGEEQRGCKKDGAAGFGNDSTYMTGQEDAKNIEIYFKRERGKTQKTDLAHEG